MTRGDQSQKKSQLRQRSRSQGFSYGDAMRNEDRYAFEMDLWGLNQAVESVRDHAPAELSDDECTELLVAAKRLELLALSRKQAA